MVRLLWLAAFLAALWASPVQAQCNGNFPAYSVCGTTTAGPPKPIPFNTVTPEQFGCKADGTTDNTACFGVLATYVNASATSATINFSPGGNYAVWPSDPGSVYLMQFTGTNGLTLNFNGAKITSAMSTSAEENYVLGFTGTNTNITINNPHYEQTAFGNTTPTLAGGGILVWLSDNATNVIINNPYEVGGLGGLNVVRTASGNRSQNIVMNGGYFSSVYYPLNFRKNGDNFTATGIYGTNVGRMYFPYNVKHHNVSFFNNYVGNVFPTILLALLALNTESADLNTLSDIVINAQFTSSAALASGLSYAAIQFEQQTGTTSAGTVKNINLHIEAIANTIGTESTAFTINKVLSNGSVDATTRGYILDNIVLSGRLDFAGGFGQTVGAFNTATNGTWSSETVRNIIFRDLVAINSTATDSFVLTATGLTGPIVFENVIADQPISITGGGTNIASSNVLVPSGLQETQQGATTIISSGNPLVVNSTNSNNAKIQFQDNGTTRGYVGATSGYAGVLFNSDGSTSSGNQNVTSSVNFVQMGSAITSAAPYIKGAGSDTDVSLQVFGQGAGSVQITKGAFIGLSTFSGQIISTFGTPTIASGACGATSNGSVAGTNQSGLITIGSASTTTCTVSFSTTITAPNACVIFPANATAAATGTTVARVSSVGTTNFVVTGSVLASANYYYICL